MVVVASAEEACRAESFEGTEWTAIKGSLLLSISNCW